MPWKYDAEAADLYGRPSGLHFDYPVTLPVYSCECGLWQLVDRQALRCEHAEVGSVELGAEDRGLYGRAAPEGRGLGWGGYWGVYFERYCSLQQ